MRKSRLFALLCAFVPGAGEMYLGLMKKGLSVMTIFWGAIFVILFLNLPPLLVVLPVIWFYSFFDVLNLRNMTEQERMMQEDKFLFDLDNILQKDWRRILGSRYRLVGGGCIFLGLYLLYNNFLFPYLHRLADLFPFLYPLLRNLPSLVVAALIILLGVYLLRGGYGAKRNLLEDDYTEYRGEKHD